MSEKRAMMFNKRAANPKYKSDEILSSLLLQPGQIIADIGSGGGYFTYRFAKAVGEKGRVYAVDTNQDFLKYIKTQAEKQGLTNIFTIFNETEYPNLPKHGLDIIFMRNVTHHLSNRVDYFKNLKNTLKSNGKIAIVEYDDRGGFFSFHKLHRHFIPSNILLEEMVQAGYSLNKSYDFLSEQLFMIFSIK